MLFFVKVYSHKMLSYFHFHETFIPVNGENISSNFQHLSMKMNNIMYGKICFLLGIKGF